jgi:hypothetical protein
LVHLNAKVSRSNGENLPDVVRSSQMMQSWRAKLL